jgi:hypothetical protein
VAKGQASAGGHTGNVTATREILEANGDFQSLLAPMLARDAEIAAIVAAWPTLPDAIRRAMVTLVNG